VRACVRACVCVCMRACTYAESPSATMHKQEVPEHALGRVAGTNSLRRRTHHHSTQPQQAVPSRILRGRSGCVGPKSPCICCLITQKNPYVKPRSPAQRLCDHYRRVQLHQQVTVDGIQSPTSDQGVCGRVMDIPVPMEWRVSVLPHEVVITGWRLNLRTIVSPELLAIF